MIDMIGINRYRIDKIRAKKLKLASTVTQEFVDIMPSWMRNWDEYSKRFEENAGKIMFEELNRVFK